MLLRSILLIVVLITAVGAGLGEGVMAQSPAPAATEPESPRDPPPAIPAALLKDTAMITQGEKLWHDQCTHCHGRQSLPRQGAETPAADLQARVRLGSSPQRISSHAAVEGRLQARRSARAGRLRAERRFLSLGVNYTPLVTRKSLRRVSGAP